MRLFDLLDLEDRHDGREDLGKLRSMPFLVNYNSPFRAAHILPKTSAERRTLTRRKLRVLRGLRARSGSTWSLHIGYARSVLGAMSGRSHGRNRAHYLGPRLAHPQRLGQWRAQYEAKERTE